jgi:CHAD domain
MAFALPKDKSVRKGLREVLAKEVKSAAESLGQSPLTSQAVHDARKHIKKSRSVLRLIRNSVRGIGPNADSRLRASGRSLSTLRDASAMLGTARGLCKGHGPEVTSAACRLVSEDLAKHETWMKRRHRRRVKSALRGLRSISRSTKQLRLKGSAKAVLKRGVKRAYERAQRKMQRACSSTAGSTFHEWRKRLKALSYHLRLLSARAPAFRRPAAQLKQLEDQLGREHNLQVLRDYITRRSARDHQRTVRRLTALAESRQEELRRATLRAGAKVLADTPKGFVRRGFGRP